MSLKAAAAAPRPSLVPDPSSLSSPLLQASMLHSVGNAICLPVFYTNATKHGLPVSSFNVASHKLSRDKGMLSHRHRIDDIASDIVKYADRTTIVRLI